MDADKPIAASEVVEMVMKLYKLASNGANSRPQNWDHLVEALKRYRENGFFVRAMASSEHLHAEATTVSLRYLLSLRANCSALTAVLTSHPEPAELLTTPNTHGNLPMHQLVECAYSRRPYPSRASRGMWGLKRVYELFTRLYGDSLVTMNDDLQTPFMMLTKSVSYLDVSEQINEDILLFCQTMAEDTNRQIDKNADRDRALALKLCINHYYVRRSTPTRCSDEASFVFFVLQYFKARLHGMLAEHIVSYLPTCRCSDPIQLTAADALSKMALYTRRKREHALSQQFDFWGVGLCDKLRLRRKLCNNQLQEEWAVNNYDDHTTT